MKTRAKKPTTSKAKESEPAPKTKTLEPSVANPPQLFILPKDASSQARIATLPNPATSTPCRYFICPDRGIFEFTSIAPPKKACRSWLLAPDQATEDASSSQDAASADRSQAYVLQKPQLLMATPIDPLFLLLPTLSPSEKMYLAFSDHLERLTDKAAHLRQMCDDESARRKLESLFEARLGAVCDTVDAVDEKMYKLSMVKLLAELLRKAGDMSEHGLPTSMEERFVRQALEVPVLSVKREESEVSASAGVEGEEENTAAGAAESQSSTAEGDSQATNASGTSAASVGTAATSVAAAPSTDAQIASEEHVRLLRLRTALTFLLNAYVPTHLRTPLTATLNSKASPADFEPLDTYLAGIAKLKKEAQALRSISDNISRKRSAMEDEEQMEKQEAKKRKKEEEDAKKKNQSRGIKQLGKVDTKGMKKMSSFFTAKAPAKK